MRTSEIRFPRRGVAADGTGDIDRTGQSRSIDVAAGWLLAPYLAWVSFAAALNAAIWGLN